VRVAVVAPDKFKGSLSAGEAAAAIERGLRSAWPDGLETRALPMADGGSAGRHRQPSRSMERSP